MFRLAAILTAVALLVGSDPVRAEAPLRAAPPMAHDRWTLEDGLPQSSITAILQARDGYLWLGTFGGLARFDGVRFREYGPANTPGLASTRILALAEDVEGRLLIGTEEGDVLRLDGERVTPLVDSAELPRAAVRALLVEPNGTVWIATGQGLVRVAEGIVAARYSAPVDLPGNDVLSLALDGRGVLWAGTSGGLVRIEGDRVESWSARGAPFNRSTIDLAFTAGGDLWLLDPRFLSRLVEGRVVETLARAQSPEFLGVLFVDARDRLWVGARDVEHQIDGALTLAATAAELGGDNVRALAQDTEGGLWVGSDGGGLHRFRPARARTLSEADGVPAGSVTAVLEDAAGTLWVGSRCGGVGRLTNGTFSSVVDERGRPFGCVEALLVDRSGALWIGEHAITRWRDGAVRRFGAAEGLPSEGVRALLEDRSGAVWAGTQAGLARLDGDRFTLFDESHGLVDRRVRELLETRDGALWIGSVGGISRWDGKRFTTLGAGRELPAAAVRALYEDAAGALWIGTYGGGLARWRGDEIQVLTTVHGLSDDVVSSILEDGEGYLWLSGNRGLARLALSDLEAVLAGRRTRVSPLVLAARDGMLSAESNGGTQPSAWRAADGRLYFPTVKGLVVVDPRQLPVNPVAPPVLIEEVRVGGVSVAPDAAIEVQPRRGDVEIRYTAPSFTDPTRVSFRYRLEGFDDDWIEAGGRRVAYYTNVPPGTYRFEVVAANEDGVWNEAGAALPFVFRPRFTQTGWFYLLVGAALVILGAALQVDRLRRARSRHRQLEAQVAERTSELSTANRRAEQHVQLLQRQDEDLKHLNRNLSRIVHQQTSALLETRDAAVITLAKLAELRDGTTGAHLERIAAYCRRLAQAIADGPYGRFDEEFIEQLARSSPLHDIGKVAIPDAILRKPGALTAEEQAVMRTHTTIGGDTLRSVLERYESQSFLTMGMEIAYSHHERWDGKGYPRGLSGLAIPLPARIVALVDVFDALTSERPYKQALPHEESVAIIAAESGAHFDPLLVDAFLAIEREFPAIRAQLAA